MKMIKAISRVSRQSSLEQMTLGDDGPIESSQISKTIKYDMDI